MCEERQLMDRITALEKEVEDLTKERDGYKVEAERGVRLNDGYTHGLSRESDLL